MCGNDIFGILFYQNRALSDLQCSLTISIGLCFRLSDEVTLVFAYLPLSLFYFAAHGPVHSVGGLPLHAPFLLLNCSAFFFRFPGLRLLRLPGLHRCPAVVFPGRLPSDFLPFPLPVPSPAASVTKRPANLVCGDDAYGGGSCLSCGSTYVKNFKKQIITDDQLSPNDSDPAWQ